MARRRGERVRTGGCAVKPPPKIGRERWAESDSPPCHGRAGARRRAGWRYPGALLQSARGRAGRRQDDPGAADPVRECDADRPALYFTVLGEPTVKLIRYQRQFGFFDLQRVGRDVHLLNVGSEAATGDLDAVLARIVAEVERFTPGIIVVDSFGTLVPSGSRTDASDAARLEQFVQRLSLHLTTWDTTSFLISEYPRAEQRHPVFTIADGIVALSQVADRNSVVRKLQVTKVRGRRSCRAFIRSGSPIAVSGLPAHPRGAVGAPSPATAAAVDRCPGNGRDAWRRDPRRRRGDAGRAGG